MLKLTPLDHPDYVPLNEAMVRIANLNGTYHAHTAIYGRSYLATGFINSQKRSKDNVTKVTEVQNRISGLPMVHARDFTLFLRNIHA